MTHEDAAMLLSWYATGALEADETRAVEAHLSGCPECTAELAELRMLHVAVAADGPEEVPFRGEMVREALAQIDREARVDAGHGGWLAGLTDALRRLLEATPVPARYALVGQLALVIALTATLVLRAPAEAPPYQTLSGTPTADHGTLLSVAFVPDAPESRIRELLLAADVEIVAGPTSLGIYTLALGDGDVEATLGRLRGSAMVSYAEPVAAP